MSSETSHTPLPWRMEESIAGRPGHPVYGNAHVRIIGSDELGCPEEWEIALLDSGHTPDELGSDDAVGRKWYDRQKANAEFIVLACNAHADLLAACKYALQFVVEYDPDLKLHPSLRAKLAAAVAKAEAAP